MEWTSLLTKFSCWYKVLSTRSNSLSPKLASECRKGGAGWAGLGTRLRSGGMCSCVCLEAAQRSTLAARPGYCVTTYSPSRYSASMEQATSTACPLPRPDT